MKHPAPHHNRRFGLYVHWPFCASKCPYCDFNSHVGRLGDTGRWRAAYEQELARLAAETGPRVLHSIFFGGGTPSLMEPQLVAAVIAGAKAAWTAANDLEITLEANPGSAEAERFASYAAAGVNRISIGVQALDDDSLGRLGRRHSTRDALAAVRLAQATFPRVSIDLIYARQWQRPADWERELEIALELGTEHLSLYQLTIEPGTVFEARHRAGHLRGLPDDEVAAALYELTQELCTRAGRPAYEISNHAPPGSECRHNLIYWEGSDYAGIGPGAHGRLTLGGTRHATTAHRLPATWLAAVERDRSGEETRTPLLPSDVALESLLMGLRLVAGLPLDSLPPGHRPPDTVVAELAADGLLDMQGGRLRITDRGRLVSDRILGRLAESLV